MNQFLRRLCFLPPLALLIVTLAFFLLRAAPGGPFDKERRSASPEVERALAARYHLDESLGRQYLRFLGDLFRGDLGVSLKYRNHSVNDILWQGLPVSLTLGALAFGFAMGIGLPVGVYAAVRNDGVTGALTTALTLASICIPGFVIGPLLLLCFALHWQWLPSGLWGAPSNVILPMITLGLYFAGRIARLAQEGMRQILKSPFITAARARGVSERRLLWQHALRLGVVPVVSYSGPMLADLLTGSFVVENIFQLPGIGVFLVNSSLGRDYPMTIGLVLLYAILLLGMNLAVDMFHQFLDPRTRD